MTILLLLLEYGGKTYITKCQLKLRIIFPTVFIIFQKWVIKTFLNKEHLRIFELLNGESFGSSSSRPHTPLSALGHSKQNSRAGSSHGFKIDI